MKTFSWALSRKRSIKSLFLALILIGTVVIVAFINIPSDNDGQDPFYGITHRSTLINQVLSRRALKRAKFCDEVPPDAKGAKWETVQDWDLKYYSDEPSLQTVLERMYGLPGSLLVEGRFVIIDGDQATSLVCLGLGSECLVMAAIVFCGNTMDYDLQSLVPLTMLVISYHSSSHILEVRDDIGHTQVFQLCSCRDKTEIWNLFISTINKNRPHFLNNFKNPCYFKNTTGQAIKRSPNLITGSLRLQCLPYFIIAGFPKSGTTDLWNGLMSHPDVKLRHLKEPKFLNSVRLKHERFDRVVARYATFYDRAADELQRLVSPIDCHGRPFPYHHGITGEGTVDSVFDHPKWTMYPGNEHCKEPVITNADYAHQLNPNMKVIFVIRNPTDRLFSDYIYEARFIKYQVGVQLFHDAVVETMKKHMECRKHHSIRACAYNDTLEDFKIRLRVGMYHTFIADWLDVFTKDNVIVINAADTVGGKKSATYKRILKFLDIRPFTRLEDFHILNRPNANTRLETESKIGEMLPETRKLIDQFYEPFNKKLTELYPEIDFNRKPKAGNS